jgi:hypothetical protein
MTHSELVSRAVKWLRPRDQAMSFCECGDDPESMRWYLAVKENFLLARIGNLEKSNSGLHGEVVSFAYRLEGARFFNWRNTAQFLSGVVERLAEMEGPAAEEARKLIGSALYGVNVLPSEHGIAEFERGGGI